MSEHKSTRSRTRYPSGRQSSGTGEVDSATLAKRLNALSGFERGRFASNLWGGSPRPFKEFLAQLLDCDLGDERPESDDLIDLFQRVVRGDEPELQHDSRFVKTLKRALRASEKQLREETERKAQLYNEAHNALGRPEPWPFNLNWLAGQQAIQSNLTRRGNRHLLDVLRVLNARAWSAYDCQAFAHERGYYLPYRSEGRPPMLAGVPMTAFKDELGISRDVAEANLRALARAGLIEDTHHKSGPHSPKLWALGVWIMGGRAPRPIYHLRETKAIKETLRTIEVHSRG